MSIPSDQREVGGLGPTPHDYDQIGWKLLVDMGYAKGLGLGKENQGIIDFLKTKQKLDNKGIGYKRKPEEWFKHQEALEKVLSNLSKMNESNGDDNEPEETCESEKKVSSLEDISKKSRSRVHYKKFTQGKDLSLYSEKDMACIIGSKKKPQEVDNSQEVSRDDSQIDSQDKYLHGGSMVDYFNKKMEALKKKREEGLLGDDKLSTVGQDEKLRSSPAIPLPDLEFEPTKTNFSFNISVQQPDPEETQLDLSLKSERKKKKRKERQEEYEAKEENLDKKLSKKSKEKKNKERVGEGEEIFSHGKIDSELQNISKKKRPDQILCKKLKQFYDKDVLKEIVGGRKLKKIFNKADGSVQENCDADVLKENVNKNDKIREKNKIFEKIGNYSDPASQEIKKIVMQEEYGDENEVKVLNVEKQVDVNDIEEENVDGPKGKRKKSKKSKNANKEEINYGENNVNIESNKDCVDEIQQVNHHVDEEALIDTAIKGKKKKSKKEKDTVEIHQISDHLNEDENLNDVDAEEKKKKLKNSAENEETMQFYGMNDEMKVKTKSKKSNNGPNEEIPQISDHFIDEIQNDQLKAKKEKTNKKIKNIGEELTQFYDCKTDDDGVKLKKKKSKKSKSPNGKTQISDYVIEEEIQNDVEMEKSKKKDKNSGEEITPFDDSVINCGKINDELKVKKKKSKRSKSPNEEIQISDHVNGVEILNDVELKRKKKKIKNIGEEISQVNDNLVDCGKIDGEVKVKNKKSKKSSNDTNEVIEISDNVVESENVNDDETKEKRKSKKQNKDENGEIQPISDDLVSSEKMNDERKVTKRKSMNDASEEKILTRSDNIVECEVLNDVGKKDETSSKKKNKNPESHQLLAGTKDEEVKHNAMNESYISATCENKDKRKRKKDKISETDEGFQRPLKKMRKFAREMSSVVDLFRGSSSKDEGQQNDALQGETIHHSDKSQPDLKDLERGAPTLSGKKLVSQRSLKELTSALGSKLIHKRECSQKTLPKISESGEHFGENYSPEHNLPLRKKKKMVKVSIDGMETREIDVSKLFPGSNISSINGYGKK